ncbi:DUF6624 domain-containing protein [Marinigracilibium pacificum]|uniref:BCE-2095-like N-terminal domain-containing protein n=1 Tax=Marinigracilibium pacificum TaxID=2729599 RepID=A0A848J389_9BACT|nr:DUF6624 domain-containing protein [Marinigracilibium pacificum]NMM48954.1 hypothetical protein [Marinigracilibium pacificum]
MKRTLSVILLFAVFIPVYSQSFNELIADAGKKYDDKEYLESADLYAKALELETGTSSHYYNAACSHALAGKSDKAISFLLKAIDTGWKDASWMKRDEDLKSIHDHEKWDSIVEKALANKAEYEKDFDKELQAQLERIYVEDQMLRHLLEPAEEKFGTDSDEMKYFWSLMQAEDKKLEKEVVEIIEKHGWVGKSLVGGKANTALWLVIQHAPLEIQEKYIPLMTESVKKGESSGSQLALLVDRIEMRNGRPQIYGSQITTNNETGETQVHELVDPANVNKRRAEVGLGPLEDYARRFGIDWSPESDSND